MIYVHHLQQKIIKILFYQIEELIIMLKICLNGVEMDVPITDI